MNRRLACIKLGVVLSVVLLVGCGEQTNPPRQDSDTKETDASKKKDGDCEPSCAGLECGDDGCGGTCGTCAEGMACSAAGACEKAACKPGEGCDDDDPCTHTDLCSADGQCSGTAYTCADDKDCTSDECDGGGGCTFAVKAGMCLINGICYEEGDTHAKKPCRECISAASDTAWTNDDSNECDDGDACLTGEYCLDGECQAGEVELDCDDDNSCTKDTCDSETGCEHAVLTGSCNDDNACTTGDTCEDGECVGTEVTCDDDNLCTSDSCDKTDGCLHEPADGDCDDGNVCTEGDSCQDGECEPGESMLDCNDNNPCTADTCSPEYGCVHAPVVASCDDGDQCTIGDKCESGECKPGSAILSCNDGNPCTQDTCSPEVGCINVAAELPCDDGNPCTVGDTCQGGVCAGGGGTLSCTDNDPCTTDACSPDVGCTHTAASGMACDDGNGCTANDICTQGVCGGSPKSCNDNNTCTTDTCNPSLPDGCVHTNNSLSCEDGSVCTTQDHCSGGACVGGVTLNCDDANACTDDSCHPATGCKHTNKVGFCEDGDPCTQGDFCANGSCVPGANACSCTIDSDCTQYDDGDKCNGILKCYKPTGSPADWVCKLDPTSVVVCGAAPDPECAVKECNPATGQCDTKAINSGGACNDGNVCTPVDQCVNGVCIGSGSLSCDDGNSCTFDSCNVLQGCLNAKKPSGTACPGGTCQNGICVQCVPSCWGKQCGDDGCGGSCGTCGWGYYCSNFQCVQEVNIDCKGAGTPTHEGCGYVDTYEGCCEGNTVVWCSNNNTYCINCGDTGTSPYCGWKSSDGLYDCTNNTGADPTGTNPRDCNGCTPQCWGKECGPDGCGGTCGSCGWEEYCHEGICYHQGLEQCLGLNQYSDTYCYGLNYTGCCDASGRLLWCDGGKLYCIDCGLEPLCGWKADSNFYDCGTNGGTDPSGQNAKSCGCIPPCPSGVSCINGICVP